MDECFPKQTAQAKQEATSLLDNLDQQAVARELGGSEKAVGQDALRGTLYS